MNKMTAVEWLASQIKTSKYFYKLMEDVNSRSTIAQSDIIEEAKEMEKEQIINAFVECWKVNVPNGIECKVSFNEWFEQFKKK